MGGLAKTGSLLAILFVMLFIMAPFLPFSVNYTASMPRGLYYTSACSPQKNDIIQFRPPERIWNFALDRQYVDPVMEGLLKKIVAVEGDRVCWVNHMISVNGVVLGMVADLDSQGRPLGHASGCEILLPDHYLPMAPDFEKSFDGRYFGFIQSSHIQFCARPLLTFD